MLHRWNDLLQVAYRLLDSPPPMEQRLAARSTLTRWRIWFGHAVRSTATPLKPPRASRGQARRVTEETTGGRRASRLAIRTTSEHSTAEEPLPKRCTHRYKSAKQLARANRSVTMPRLHGRSRDRICSRGSACSHCPTDTRPTQARCHGDAGELGKRAEQDPVRSGRSHHRAPDRGWQ